MVARIKHTNIVIVTNIATWKKTLLGSISLSSIDSLHLLSLALIAAERLASELLRQRILIAKLPTSKKVRRTIQQPFTERSYCKIKNAQTGTRVADVWKQHVYLQR